MSNHFTDLEQGQQDLFETAVVRSLLDRLLTESRLYKRSSDYFELLQFVVRLRQFAPFNAMLLQIQKPGLVYAASAQDWRKRFGRSPKDGARPLLIMWPFGPVALVYDVLDTEGRPLPKDVLKFVAHGEMSPETLSSFTPLLSRRNIEVEHVDAGDASAGLIRVLSRGKSPAEANRYRIRLNHNHPPAVKFATLAHELGHLFLGHLGPDPRLKIPRRSRPTEAHMELEAESVAFIVCHRQGIEPRSHSYLAEFVKADTALDDLDLYQIMRAAGLVEGLLELGQHSKMEWPGQGEQLSLDAL